MLGSTNISTTLVANTLGVSTRNVGSLCTSTSINKWSFWKPVSIAKSTGITESDLYSVDDGFIISSYNVPGAALRALVADTAWTYKRPTGTSSSPYRLGDFRNYDPDQVAWYTLKTVNANSGASGDTIKFQFENTKYSDLNWLVNNFSAFSSYASSTQGGVLDIGLLLTSKWDSTIAGAYYYKISDYLDFNDTEHQLVLTITNDLPEGKYYVVPVLSTYTSALVHDLQYISDANGTIQAANWYPIPATPIQITVTAVPQYNPVQYITMHWDNGTCTNDGTYCSASFRFWVEVSSNASTGISGIQNVSIALRGPQVFSGSSTAYLSYGNYGYTGPLYAGDSSTARTFTQNNFEPVANNGDEVTSVEASLYFIVDSHTYYGYANFNVGDGFTSGSRQFTFSETRPF